MIDRLCRRPFPPESISVTACEVDASLADMLAETLSHAADVCASVGIEFAGDILHGDFLEAVVRPLQCDKRLSLSGFNLAILNPPYRKIRTRSPEHRMLREAGIETTNLYAAFVWASLRCLSSGGDLVAITPRSFCNGPYFRAFRRALLRVLSLRRLHVFDARNIAFSTDGVLQENVIVHGRKCPGTPNVVVSASNGEPHSPVRRRVVAFENVVRPDDPEQFIRLPTSPSDDHTSEALRALPSSLDDLGLKVSTGKVVDFRTRDNLRANPTRGSVPLIYPCHLKAGEVAWPLTDGRKPNALALNASTSRLLVPSGTYVLVKRFSTKEERRRVVATLVTAERLAGDWWAFENHLNYFHSNQNGLPQDLAAGIAAYLNSTQLDRYFRVFSGHTQVNATDLRILPYPSVPQLQQLASTVGSAVTNQALVDRALADIL